MLFFYALLIIAGFWILVLAPKFFAMAAFVILAPLVACGAIIGLLCWANAPNDHARNQATSVEVHHAPSAAKPVRRACGSTASIHESGGWED